MIPNQVDVVEVTSSGFADSFGMTIDEQSLVHIMDVLTKMYSDPALAVIREYSANALDSHVKAGNQAPIQVTLPSRWNNEFIVRDFGVGMDVDYMRNVYSKYGASDKRDSDDYIGGFGIGSKAGLAYTHSFAVTAWQNGKRSRAIVSLDENGAGKFDIVDVVDSAEPTGVEIKISVKGDTVEFNRKANHFFSFWTPGTVLVSGEEPEFKTGTPVGDNMFYNRSGNAWNKLNSYVVVGSVPYVLDMDQIPNGEFLYAAGIGVVLRVGVGEVAIAPSREALSYTPGTIAVIDKALSGLWESIVQAEILKINSAPTYKAAYRLLSGIGHPLSSDNRFKNFVYKGAQFQARIQHPHKKLYFDYNDRGMVDERNYIDLGHATTHTELIVTGFTGKVLSTVMKRKIRQYAEDNNLNEDYTLIMDKDTDELWLSEIARVDFDTIKAVKLPAGNYVANKKIPTYDVYTKDGHSLDTTITGKTIYYASPVELRRKDRWGGTYTRVQTAKLAELMDATIVVISKNRFEKFERDYPNAKPLADAVNAKIKELADKSSDFDANDISDYEERSFLGTAPVAEILDAELVSLIQAHRSKQQDVNWNAANALYTTANRGTMGIKAPVRKQNRAQDILDRYPLIAHVGSKNMDHLIIYINTIFERNNI